MKYILSVFSLLSVILILSSCYEEQVSNIKQIRSFNEVDFKTIKSNTLVIFDVDETLIQPKDSYLINEHTPQAEAFFLRLLKKYPEIKDWNYIASIVLQDAEWPLLEPEIIQKIKELQNRGIIVVACTAINTGKYGMLQSMEHWRYAHLKSLGFEGSYDQIILYFDSFKHNPVFYKGILATDTEPKGPVIGKFLDVMNLHPQQIIMFDDSLDYLNSVLQECKKRNINFRGYHYQGALQKPWNEELIEIQADYLIQHKKWLSDEAIQQ